MYHGERLNSYTHLIGAVAAAVGAIALVWPAAMKGLVWETVAYTTYGLSLIALYSFSTLYHSTNGPKKALFRQLDHLAIYMLIAGSYTPFLLITLRDGNGWTMFAVIWSLAVVGMVLECLPIANRRLWSIPIYLLMGWLSMAVVKPLMAALPEGGFSLLLAGGLAYTLGIVFYVFDKKIQHFHGVWHLFVLAGSVCHFFSIYLFVA
ncbi:MAG: PAQR family membrane homeostasis protein TrhA [Spongiibacteraceae bacterium]